MGVNMKRRNWMSALCGACLVITTGAAPLNRNLLTNGDFETWPGDVTEPPGWHTKLTSIIPIPEYTDPENKKGRTGKYQFKCGCGHIWGTVRPWAGLCCESCGHLNTGLEDSGDYYLDNDQYVKPGNGRAGRGAHVTMPAAVGNVEGVRVISDLIRAEPGAAYEISFDAKSKGTHIRVFVEGFREMKHDKDAMQWAASLPVKVNPLEQQYRLKRVFRKHINADAPTQWERFTYKFAPPKRYEFDLMFVTLYAYLPGEAWFDNVVLRKLTPQETAAYR